MTIVECSITKIGEGNKIEENVGKSYNKVFYKSIVVTVLAISEIQCLCIVSN